MTDKLTNLDTILTEYRNPNTNEYKEYEENLLEEIKTDADNKVIKKILIEREREIGLFFAMMQTMILKSQAKNSLLTIIRNFTNGKAVHLQVFLNAVFRVQISGHLNEA